MLVLIQWTMADVACGSVGSTEPEIYKTNHGKVIVGDELLNFLAVKMRIRLRSLAAKIFDSTWIEIWSEMCSTTQLCVSNQGAQKDAKQHWRYSADSAYLKFSYECKEVNNMYNSDLRPFGAQESHVR